MASDVHCPCGERVTGYALGLGQRFGVYRCGGTHCKNADSPLMRALRELPSTPTLNLARRVAVLETVLRAHGIELPPETVGSSP